MWTNKWTVFHFHGHFKLNERKEKNKNKKTKTNFWEQPLYAVLKPFDAAVKEQPEWTSLKSAWKERQDVCRSTFKIYSLSFMPFCSLKRSPWDSFSFEFRVKYVFIHAHKTVPTHLKVSLSLFQTLSLPLHSVLFHVYFIYGSSIKLLYYVFVVYYRRN